MKNNTEEDRALFELLQSENIDDVKLGVMIALKTKSIEFIEEYIYKHGTHNASTEHRYSIKYKDVHIFVGFSALALSSISYADDTIEEINIDEDNHQFK